MPIEKRWLPNPESKYRTSIKFRNAIRKHGWDTFKTEVLTSGLTAFEANSLEQALIKKYNTISNGYNLQSGGKNFKHSEETKSKIGNGNRGKKRSDEFKKNRSIYQSARMTKEYRKYLSERSSGWHHTKEARKKIGLSSVGNKNCLGRIQLLDERLKRSASAKRAVPLLCGHKKHNRYSKCINTKEILNENNSDTTSFEDTVS